MPKINDIEAKRRIRVINYPSRFVERNDPKLSDPSTYPNHFPIDYDVRKRIENWAPFFLKMLFERYKVLKANGFKQLEEEIPDIVRLL